MHVYPFFLLTLLSLAGAAMAGTTHFDLAPGESGDFLVEGTSTPTITLHQGEVVVRHMTRVADMWLVSLECVSSTPCSGRIDA